MPTTADRLEVAPAAPQFLHLRMGSSTETVAFQAYEIIKIDHEFLQFFTGIKNISV